jgi:lipopolysaccharide biosynthesis protein
MAVIVHAFYGEILKEMLEHLSENSKISCKLFVTSPQEKEDEINEVLKNSNINFEFFATENRGRDVLPFLKISRIAIDRGFRLILKLHTKKSDHRMTASIWRKEIFEALLPQKSRDRIIDIFNNNQNIGILGPAGHIVPMSLYYGINAKGVGYLCRQLGVDTRELQSMNFVAGSMFYIRMEALLPLLNLNMPDTIFETEAGQLDGTMAHAYERAFAISSFSAGLNLVDSKFDSRKPNPTITTNHRFTW